MFHCEREPCISPTEAVCGYTQLSRPGPFYFKEGIIVNIHVQAASLCLPSYPLTALRSSAQAQLSDEPS